MPTRQRIQSRPELVRDTLIFLTPDEVKFANLIGNRRSQGNRKSNVRDNSYSKSNPIEIDELGARAELAIHKVCNQYPEDMFVFQPKSKKNKTDLGDIFIEGFGVVGRRVYAVHQPDLMSFDDCAKKIRSSNKKSVDKRKWLE